MLGQPWDVHAAIPLCFASLRKPCATEPLRSPLHTSLGIDTLPVHRKQVQPIRQIHSFYLHSAACQ